MNADLAASIEGDSAAMVTVTEPQAIILIVEDDEDLANLLEYRLRKEGFNALIARDGTEACRLFGEVGIDLVLLDILMPGMDGWEVCHRLRDHRDQRVATTPVIMLTALSAGENRIKGLECGADVYLSKPYSIREVVLNCRRLIAERRERFRLQAELDALQEMKQGGSEAQRMFFHELRSQFTVIGGLCGRMLKSDDPQYLSELARDRGYLEVIRTSVNQVADMADEVLILSKLQNADLSLPRGDCRLDEIITEVLAVYNAKAQMKGVSLSVSALPPQPVKLHRLALKIIIASLLENAVKYCPPSSTVTLQATAAAAVVSIEVRDQGPGIPFVEQEKIFEPYFRGEAMRASHQGNGLGLFSVKRLAEALGGAVSVNSSPGTGSLFRVVFNNC